MPDATNTEDYGIHEEVSMRYDEHFGAEIPRLCRFFGQFSVKGMTDDVFHSFLDINAIFIRVLCFKIIFQAGIYNNFVIDLLPDVQGFWTHDIVPGR